MTHAVIRETLKKKLPTRILDLLLSSVSGQTLLLGDPLSLELLENVVQVTRVRVTVARQVGAKLGLVVHLVPDDCVRLACSAGRTDGENEPAVPGHQQQPQHLASLFTVRQVAVSGKSTCCEGFAMVWVLWALYAWRNVVNDAYGFALRMSR